MTLRGIGRVTLAVALVATLALAVQRPGSAAPGQATEDSFVADELLIRFHDGSSEDSRAALLGALGITVLDVYPSSGVMRLRVSRGSLEETRRWLLAAGVVEFAEPNYHLHVAQAFTADPRYVERQTAIYQQLDGPRRLVRQHGQPRCRRSLGRWRCRPRPPRSRGQHLDQPR